MPMVNRYRISHPAIIPILLWMVGKSCTDRWFIPLFIAIIRLVVQDFPTIHRSVVKMDQHYQKTTKSACRQPGNNFPCPWGLQLFGSLDLDVELFPRPSFLPIHACLCSIPKPCGQPGSCWWYQAVWRRCQGNYAPVLPHRLVQLSSWRLVRSHQHCREGSPHRCLHSRTSSSCLICVTEIK